MIMIKHRMKLYRNYCKFWTYQRNILTLMKTLHIVHHKTIDISIACTSWMPPPSQTIHQIPFVDSCCLKNIHWRLEWKTLGNSWSFFINEKLRHADDRVCAVDKVVTSYIIDTTWPVCWPSRRVKTLNLDMKFVAPDFIAANWLHI